MAKKTEKRGRKPVKDKVVQVTTYVRQSVVDANGGIENCRVLYFDFLTKNI